MAKAKNTALLIRQLKKQVALLRRKEKAARNQMKKSFTKLKEIGRSYEKKLAVNIQQMKEKMTAAQAAAYRKAADEVERQIPKKIAAKQKLLGHAVSQFEKRFAAKLGKVLEQKAKRLGKKKRGSAKKVKRRKK